MIQNTAPFLASKTLGLFALLGLAAFTVTPPSESPAPEQAIRPAVPYDLVEVVPLETTSVWCWRGDQQTEGLETQIIEVLDSVLEARFDEFALDTLDELGAPADLMKEVRGARNLIRSIGSLVSWRDLVGEEVVYAEGTHAGRLLACRPAPRRVADIERSLAATLGSVAGMLFLPVRYDIHEDEVTGTTTYRLTVRSDQNESALVEVAVRDGVFLFGAGDRYFATALALLEGGGGERLATSVRFLEAFGELPMGTAGRSYIDMQRLAGDLERMTGLLGEREFNSGFWQSMINDAQGLVGSMETIATTTHCVGDRLVMETLTRFDPESSERVRAGLSAPASPSMLRHVPEDVVSFDMRGNVDPQPIFRWARERWASDWEPAADLLWIYDIVEAAVGLSLERDILSWLGSEQVTMVVPARRKGKPEGSTDTVMISRVRDAAGARKCLERAEAVFEVAAPRIIEGLQGMLREAQVPFMFNARITPGRAPLTDVRNLKIMAFPLPVPPVVYGMVDDYLVFATSREALQSALDVAAQEEAGLGGRDLVASLLGKSNLCSARMAPAGAGIQGTAQTLTMISGWLEGMGGDLTKNNPQGAQALNAVVELMSKVGTVLSSVDFLGDSLTTSEIREGGLARYEVTTLDLLLPEEQRDPTLSPSVAVTDDGSTH